MSSQGEFDRVSEYLGTQRWRSFVRLLVSNLVAYRAGKMAERYSLLAFDASHLASAARLREEVVDLQFLAFNARLVAAERGSLVPVYERA